jgi:hypothetical protein
MKKLSRRNERRKHNRKRAIPKCGEQCEGDEQKYWRKMKNNVYKE